MPDTLTLRLLLEKLTGEPPSLPSPATDRAEALLPDPGIGCSQLNELLLLLGYDRVSPPFFQYLLDGSTEYKRGAAFSSREQLRDGVDRFRTHAMLQYGNIKFAFKNMSPLDEDELADEISIGDPVDETKFTSRHDPVLPVEAIDGKDTYYLGYIIGKDLKKRLEDNPDDAVAQEQEAKKQAVVESGLRNQQAYLASDHMDVYVATSMREHHEFYLAHETIANVFASDRLKPLKLRWFDPTQAYCYERIDKGLAEALMLKRADCTLYLAQETDTLGKDSELASTLAQGKVVIAYVPKVTEEDEDSYTASLLGAASELHPDRSSIDVLTRQLQIFSPHAAWDDPEIRSWIDDPASMTEDKARKSLARTIRAFYDKRADTLKSIHPLGVQVFIETGVANGVLVARTTDECAELIYQVLTNQLEFDIDEREIREQTYLLLRERLTQSVFRVVTGDRLLTNTFWNFYPRS